MKTLPVALALSMTIAAHAAAAADETPAGATTHAMQSASAILSGTEIRASASANGITGSLNGSTGAVNVLQNSGNNVSQSAQNALARITACPCGGPVLAEATGTQLTHVSMRNARIEGAGGSNSIRGSFNGSSGMINVVQNTGSNVVQSAQNSLAMVVRRP